MPSYDEIRNYVREHPFVTGACFGVVAVPIIVWQVVRLRNRQQRKPLTPIEQIEADEVKSRNELYHSYRALHLRIASTMELKLFLIIATARKHNLAELTAQLVPKVNNAADMASFFDELSFNFTKKAFPIDCQCPVQIQDDAVEKVVARSETAPFAVCTYRLSVEKRTLADGFIPSAVDESGTLRQGTFLILVNPDNPDVSMAELARAVGPHSEEPIMYLYDCLCAMTDACERVLPALAFWYGLKYLNLSEAWGALLLCSDNLPRMDLTTSELLQRTEATVLCYLIVPYVLHHDIAEIISPGVDWTLPWNTKGTMRNESFLYSLLADQMFPWLTRPDVAHWLASLLLDDEAPGGENARKIITNEVLHHSPFSFEDFLDRFRMAVQYERLKCLGHAWDLRMTVILPSPSACFMGGKVGSVFMEYPSRCQLACEGWTKGEGLKFLMRGLQDYCEYATDAVPQPASVSSTDIAPTVQASVFEVVAAFFRRAIFLCDFLDHSKGDTSTFPLDSDIDYLAKAGATKMFQAHLQFRTTLLEYQLFMVKRWLAAGQVVPFSSGSQTHAVGIILHRNWFIVCNRGVGSCDSGIRIYKTCDAWREMLDRIAAAEDNCNSFGQKSFFGLLPERYDFMNIWLKRLITQQIATEYLVNQFWGNTMFSQGMGGTFVTEIKMRPQTTGNCCFSSAAKPLMLIALALGTLNRKTVSPISDDDVSTEERDSHLLSNFGDLDLENLKTTAEQLRPLYKAITAFIRHQELRVGLRFLCPFTSGPSSPQRTKASKYFFALSPAVNSVSLVLNILERLGTKHAIITVASARTLIDEVVPAVDALFAEAQLNLKEQSQHESEAAKEATKQLEELPLFEKMCFFYLLRFACTTGVVDRVKFLAKKADNDNSLVTTTKIVLQRRDSPEARWACPANCDAVLCELIAIANERYGTKLTAAEIAGLKPTTGKWSDVPSLKETESFVQS